MSDAVQQIKDRLDIVEVISPYVELHKAGKNFKGKSPFSAEKTPSFYVSPDRGMYYCFSTSQGGDIFTFVQAMEGVDFKESLRILAQKAGVELVPENPEAKTERDRSYAALAAATEFYQARLEHNDEALAYLERRGLTPLTIGKWQIGYAPGPPAGGWREVKEHLEGKKYTKDELVRVGLIKTTEGGKEPYDVFRDRVMFPMRDSGGKVVAFSGRILSIESEAPKYVNSPETPLYKKSELLYGYDKAKQGIRQLDFSLIVEGQFDVVMCHQAGYTNTVAVSGTALTPQHVQYLERLSKRVVLALDADRAGIAAMKRAAEVMLARGIDVKVAVMPEGKDPADLILEGVDGFKKIVGNALHVIEFLLIILKQQTTDARALKLKAREEILPFILLVPDRIDQEHFVQVVAESITSTTDAVRFELDRLREEAPASTSELTPKPEVTANTQTTLTSLIAYMHAVLYLLDKTRSDAVKKILTDLQQLETADEKAVAAATFTLEKQFEKMSPQAIDDDVVAHANLLRTTVLKKQLGETRDALKAAEDIGDDEAITSTLARIAALQQNLREPAFDLTIFN